MANFQNNALTDNGRVLLSHVQVGAVFTPTKIVVGSGNIPVGHTPRTMTAVVAPVEELAINKKQRSNDGKATIGGMYSNQDIASDWYFRELALFAKAVYPDGSETDEVLYSYGNAGDTADLMPAYSSGQPVERQIDIVTYVGNEAEVDLTIDPGVAATREMVETMMDEAGVFDHASRHAIGGSDPITPAAIGAVRNTGDTLSGTYKYKDISKEGAGARLIAENGFKMIHQADIGDNTSNRNVFVVNPHEKGLPNALQLARVDAGGAGVWYDVLHTGNKNLVSAADVGAVSKSGDTMTGGLKFADSAGTTNGIVYANDYNAYLIANNKGDTTNSRMVSVWPKWRSLDLKNALNFVEKTDGVEKAYPIYHTGNKPTAADVGARPADWMPTAADVGAMPRLTNYKELSTEGWYTIGYFQATTYPATAIVMLGNAYRKTRPHAIIAAVDMTQAYNPSITVLTSNRGGSARVFTQLRVVKAADKSGYYLEAYYGVNEANTCYANIVGSRIGSNEWQIVGFDNTIATETPKVVVDIGEVVSGNVLTDASGVKLDGSKAMTGALTVESTGKVAVSKLRSVNNVQYKANFGISADSNNLPCAVIDIQDVTNNGDLCGIRVSPTDKRILFFDNTGDAAAPKDILHTGNKEKIFTYGTEDLTPGVSKLETGKLYFVYE